MRLCSLGGGTGENFVPLPMQLGRWKIRKPRKPGTHESVNAARSGSDKRGRQMARSALRAFAGIALALGGCAASPESIPPSYVSPVTYQNWTCDQLAEEGHRLVSALAVASQRQDQAATGDAVGVLLIGLPVSSMSGHNIAPEIGRLKGEHEALHRAAIVKGCRTESAAPATTASIPRP